MSNSPELFAAELQAAEDVRTAYNDCDQYTELCDIAKQALEGQLAVTSHFTEEQLDADDLPENASKACKLYGEIYALSVGTLTCHVGDIMPKELARPLSYMNNLTQVFREAQLHKVVNDIQSDVAKETA